MGLMRSLLVEAQTKFRKMVDDNKQLATHIDGSIHAANEEVQLLRAELNETNRRLSQISEVAAGNEDTKGITDNNEVNKTFHSNIKKECTEEILRLKDENTRLEMEVEKFKKEVEEMKTSNKLVNATDESKVNELKLDLIQTKQELNRAKEALSAMKADRKRLKAEKLDLLNQMKQLYCTLEDKESELRDFIRNYEMRMKESDQSIKQLAVEKEDAEREKWDILRKAHEAAERAVTLRADLDQKENYIKKVEAELAETRSQLSLLRHQMRNSISSSEVASPSSGDGQTPSGDELPPYSHTPPSSIQELKFSSCDSRNDSSHSVFLASKLGSYKDISMASTNQGGSYKDISMATQNVSCKNSPLATQDGSCKNIPIATQHGSCKNIPIATQHGSCKNIPIATKEGSFKDLTSAKENLQFKEDCGEGDYVSITPNAENKRKKKTKSTGTFSKIFGKSKSRRSIAISDPSIMDEMPSRLSCLTQENYQEKLLLLAQAKECHVDKWRANQVLAWIEIEMNMPIYGKACSENIKSGKVLLGLSDSDLDSALGITSVLHKRKLRLAVEELRDPENIKFEKAPKIDHTWVAHKWIQDLGLSQHSTAFDCHLVDGRLLNALGRKDLEKYLGIHRKFHQASILHGVELLRRIDFDKEVLSERRSKCEENDCDPLVWTNHRIMKWIRSIDLEEYAENLKESGVHGAVLVLEPTFNADTLATAMGIPPSKSYVKRHLATEFETLVRPARAAIEACNATNSKKAISSAEGSFIRSYRGGPNQAEREERGSNKRISFRGSLGRALGKKVKQNLDTQQNSKSGLDHSKKSKSMELDGTSV